MFRSALALALTLALGATPGSGQSFVDSTAASGISVAPYAFGHSFGRGSSWDDFDGDGDQDVFVCEGVGGDYVVWWNNGGTFTRQVIVTNPGTIHDDHQAVSADFDNDGDQDVFVAVGFSQPNLLFVNDGAGNFTEEAALRGLAHTGAGMSACWGDFDRDGWLDLYVGNYENPLVSFPASLEPNLLYRNNGDGTFTDVTAFSGAGFPSLAFIALWLDHDQDGWPDLMIGNDKGDGVGQPVGVFKNGRNGTFVNVATAINADVPAHCMGLTVGDIENDGDWDVFLTNVPFTGNTILHWDSALSAYTPQPTGWTQSGTLWGVMTNANGWGCRFFDADHDGWLDLLFVHNSPIEGTHLLKGNGLPPFTSVTATSGVSAIPFAYTCAVIDYDDDGDLDIWTPGDVLSARLLENVGATGNWLMIDLEGTISNRDAFGATVLCKTSQGTFRRTKLSGEGFISDGDKRLHFGLGTAAQVDEIEIRWPSGTVSYLANVPANQMIQIVEPSFQNTGTLLPGSANPITLELPADAFIPYVCGVTVDVFSEFPLGDGRSVLCNLADPVLAATTLPGNNALLGANGFFDAVGQASMIFNVPNFPSLSGFPFWMIGVSWHPLYGTNVKSIVGPQAFRVG